MKGNGISTQTNVRSVSETFDNVDLFRGMLRTDNGNLADYDFMVGGYGYFFWVSGPMFMRNEDSKGAAIWNRFKNLTEKGTTQFDGIQDMSVTTEDITGGIAGNSFKVATNMKDDFESFTLKVYENNGSPIREGISYWLDGVRDPKTGFATYHGLLGESSDGKLPYGARNHTAEAIYIVTDPSGSEAGIEYACLLTNIMPTKKPMAHLNMTHGDHPVVQMDLEFTANKYESTWINAQAKDILAKKKIIENYYTYIPKNYQDVSKIEGKNMMDSAGNFI